MLPAMIAFIGTYAPADQNGIFVCSLDMSTGELRQISAVKGVGNPSFLAVHPDGRHLYAVAEIGDFNNQQTGGVAAFAIDPESAALEFVNAQPSGGRGPCHISIHPNGRYAFAANYGGGSVSILPINEDGSLGPPSDFVQHTGSSVNPNRQKAPHAHSINIHPNGRFAYAADLGLDKILIYSVDLENGKIPPNDPPYAETRPGAGPRHFAFRPDGAFAYVINELDSTLNAFRVDAESGALTLLQTIDTVPSGFDGTNYTAEVRVAPNGRFVYGSNRGHNSVAVYRIDDEKGTVQLVEHESTRGDTPRNFGIDPTGQFLIAANQNSDDLYSFRIDPQTGELTPTGSSLNIPKPVCVQFLQLSD